MAEPDETHPPIHPGLQAREVTITVMKLISKCDALQCCLERGQQSALYTEQTVFNPFTVGRYYTHLPGENIEKWVVH